MHLPETADEGEEAAVEDGKLTPQPRPMTGWAILLMWIPAAGDLMGTVVCLALSRVRVWMRNADDLTLLHLDSS